MNLRPAAIGLSFAAVLWMVVPTSCLAEDTFGAAVPVQTLTKYRGGDGTTDSNNNILTSTSTQGTTATNQNNSIGGDSVAGNANISNDAFNNMQGMTNVVINTAPMANVQGIMSLNVTLQ